MSSASFIPMFSSTGAKVTGAKVTGAKGSDVYDSTGDPRLDLSVKCVRGADADSLREGIKAVLALGTQQALEDAFVLAFQARDVRGGKGERMVFHGIFGALHLHQKTLALTLIDLIPHYGCWQDIFALCVGAPEDFRTAAIALVAKQLIEDSTNPDGKLSLAAKWAPREDSKYKDFAKALAYHLFPRVPTHPGKMRRYRQFVSDLNAKLKTVETLMCSDRWDEIVPASVPGRAGKLYSKAFLNLPSTYNSKTKVKGTGELRHPDDPKRMECRTHFEEHYAKAARGEAKVHGADTLFPHELVKKAYNNSGLSEPEKDQIRGVWRGMVEKAKAGGGLGRSIFMSDFSGSMQCSTAGDIPYWVSMALGILGAEACSEEFKDRLMTFDSDPVWHHFTPGSDLFERIRTIQESRVGQGTSTDFQKAMDLVLQTLKEKRCRPGQEPENLIVLTDMGWDQACDSAQTSAYTGNRYRHVVKTAPWETHVTMIQEAFKRAGEDMWGPGQGFLPPRIVIWNLAANPQTDFHATADTPGVAMLSGWSPTQFEVLQKEGPRQLTAYEMLRIQLDDPKYQRVRDQIRAAISAVAD